MNRTLERLAGIAIIILTIFLAGCSAQQTRNSSSVVDFLYPKGLDKAVQPSVPVLSLPLKVGIAFVPEKLSVRNGVNLWSGLKIGEHPNRSKHFLSQGGLSEHRKTIILERVADHFRQLKFVTEIEVIPSAYLTEEGGFRNLDQISTMYGVDVMALVSYDQVQFTDSGALSLSYWTLVGAYVISGEKNDTSTMLDTSVFDIKSRKMLFRAPGTSVVKGNSTPVNLTEELRKDSAEGYQSAADEMVVNLGHQLARFQQKVKDKPELVQIKYREGYGGGTVGYLEIFLFIFLALYGLAYRRINSHVNAS
ncbi:rhombotarget lipoprotein [Litoribrevibacter euphylliae]|uniref:Rhombotarget lipoprotein n=1 Tax=Litoribrevibacter euphylliae TaxID=1834034 RepID=A0ABV7HPK4_9GAMM